MLVLNLLNRIFGNKEDLSRSEIDSYVKDKRELQKIEEKSLSDDFNADALEGFDKHGLGTDAMKSLDEKMLRNQSQSSSKVLYIAVFSAAALIVLLIGFYSIQELQRQNDGEQMAKLERDTNEENEYEPKLENEELEEDSNLSMGTEKVGSSENQAEKNRKREKFTSNTKEDIILEKSDASHDQNGIAQMPASDEVEDIDFELSETLQSRREAPSSSNENSTLSYKTAKEVYFHDFKVVDYRAYRSADKMEKNEVISGVPANKKEQGSSLDFQDDDLVNEKDYSYILYLEETMRLMKDEQYESSIARFQNILSVYPDDVNANFYLGFAYFNKGMYNNAIPVLKKAYTFFYGNFFEEAQIYLAKSYLVNGEVEQAKEILQRTIDSNGFYKEEAQELLKGI